MIPQETRVMIRHFLRQGETKSQVARRLGVSRQTVYNHLCFDPEKKRKRKKRASKLDPYKGYIRARLEEFELPAAVVFREIRERVYGGSITILREYVRGVKDRKVTRITQRFETLAGRQAQVDWGECGSIVVEGIRVYNFLSDNQDLTENHSVSSIHRVVNAVFYRLVMQLYYSQF